MVRHVCLVTLCAAAAPVLSANPELLGYEQGIEDPESESEALRLSDLALDFDVVGALADVTVTARFANPSDETLEGRFNFELPAGAVVTGYALDIEGALIEGVLVEPLRTRRPMRRRCARASIPVSPRCHVPMCSRRGFFPFRRG